MTKVAIIGFGEAGPVLGKACVNAGAEVTAFDILMNEVYAGRPVVRRMGEAGVSPAISADVAASGADLIISAVTASEAEAAAASIGPLQKGQIYIDINSVGPASKRALADTINTAGGAFIEAVAMDTIPQCGAQVPLLLCGPAADRVTRALNRLGLNATNLGSEYGLASSTKLVRSIMIKGMEAVFAEAMEVGGQIGVTEAVMASVQRTFPGIDWKELVGYHLSRIRVHGVRRADEMLECAAMVEDRGLDATFTRAIADKHRDIAVRSEAAGTGTRIADFQRVLNERTRPRGE